MNVIFQNIFQKGLQIGLNGTKIGFKKGQKHKSPLMKPNRISKCPKCIVG